MLFPARFHLPVRALDELLLRIPWNSLGAELTPDYHERTSVRAVKSAIQKIPELAMFVAAQFDLAVFNDYRWQTDILRGARVCARCSGR